MPPISLSDRAPIADRTTIGRLLTPPRRFADAAFETYRPNPQYRSQRAALEAVSKFAHADGAPRRRSRLRRRAVVETPRCLYLDGGFGVGKTHLLVAAAHRRNGRSAFLSFADLTAMIGYLGIDGAVRAFEGCGLICIDEFELDDIANTLMTVTFLRRVVPAGGAVMTTSNSLPDRLGEGRFFADDFRREIAEIADWFETIRIDGPDYRRSDIGDVELSSDGLLDALAGGGDVAGVVTDDEFDDLLALLRRTPAALVPALLADVDAVIVRAVKPVEDQNAALLFAHFVDKVYESGIVFGASGCDVDVVFDASYRSGGFRKKYGRAESRLAALAAEAHVRLVAGGC